MESGGKEDHDGTKIKKCGKITSKTTSASQYLYTKDNFGQIFENLLEISVIDKKFDPNLRIDLFLEI